MNVAHTVYGGEVLLVARIQDGGAPVVESGSEGGA